MLTQQARAAEFYAVYPALHELRASINWLLEQLNSSWPKACWATSADLRTYLDPFVSRIETALGDDRVLRIDQEGFREILDDIQFCITRLFDESNDPIVARYVLQNVVKELDDLIWGQARAALTRWKHFQAEVSTIRRYDGSLPPDAIGSILPAELRDADNTRPGGCGLFSRYGDPVLDEDSLSVSWAGKPSFRFPSSQQFRFVQMLLKNKGRYVPYHDLLDALGLDSIDEDGLKHLKRRVVSALRGAGYEAIAHAIKSRPPGDGLKGYGFII